MRRILLIGAGKSTSSLVKYLKEKSEKEQLQIIIGDLSLENAEKFAGNHPNTKAIQLDIFKAEERQTAIKEADIVISMLPARFHIEVAKDCVNFNKNLVTASYVSDEMQALDEEVKKKEQEEAKDKADRAAHVSCEPFWGWVSGWVPR